MSEGRSLGGGQQSLQHLVQGTRAIEHVLRTEQDSLAGSAAPLADHPGSAAGDGRVLTVPRATNRTITVPMRSHGSPRLGRLVALWFAGTLVITCAAPQRAAAQAPDEAWATPVNLSHSGATTDPAMVIDSNGVVHVIWRDASADYIYTRLEGGEWSTPRLTELERLFRLAASPASSRPSRVAGAEPLAVLHSGPNPLFVAGPRQQSFATWVTPERLLYSSRAANRDFGAMPGWGARTLLSASVASFAAAIDARGTLHVAFYRIEDRSDDPPGIYYTRSTNGGLSWTTATRLYESPYFHTLGEGEANLSLATGGTPDAPIVYLTWDNRPRKQVFVATSTNGGASWEGREQVDGPSPDSGPAGPFNIRIGAAGNAAILVWQNGEPGGTCTQSFKSSADAGTTWSDAQLMIEGLPGCATANEFVVGLEQNLQGLLYLLTDIQDQSYLSVWNGSRWSEPQAQPILSGFEEPEIYSPISFGCHRAAGFGERLYVIGCDKGDGGDIWITSRDLGSTESWFSPEVWTRPVPVTGAEVDVSALELIPTDDGLVHAVFSQRQDPAIYYTRWDGSTWSRITAVLQLPDGEASSPAIAAGPENDLFLIALSTEGALHYVRAKGMDAVTASRWSPPTRLPTNHDGPVSPADVAWDADGTVYVAYSVPVYEERGVYLIKSEDRGETWLEPMQVFDGAEAGFDLVGSPALLVTANGPIHVLWKRQSIPTDGASQPLSLYHAMSEDAGRTFGEPELVVEGPVTWHKIVADGKGNLHRLWQRSDAPSTLWDQVSVDGGHSWEVPQQLPVEGGQPTVTLDPAGQLHLVGPSDGSLSHWLWNGSRWRAEAPLRWTPALAQGGLVELLASAVNTEGEFVALVSGLTSAGAETARLLQYTTRHLNLPGSQVATPGESINSPLSANDPATPAPEPTVTPQGATVSSAPGPIQSREPWRSILLTVVPSAVLLLAVFGVVSLRARRGRTR